MVCAGSVKPKFIGVPPTHVLLLVVPKVWKGCLLSPFGQTLGTVVVSLASPCALADGPAAMASLLPLRLLHHFTIWRFPICVSLCSHCESSLSWLPKFCSSFRFPFPGRKNKNKNRSYFFGRFRSLRGSRALTEIWTFSRAAPLVHTPEAFVAVQELPRGWKIVCEGGVEGGEGEG
jgi:hypothetical protein